MYGVYLYISLCSFQCISRNRMFDYYNNLLVNIVLSDHLYLKFILHVIVEQELLTLPEHLSSPPVFSGVRVTRSLVICVCFVDRCLSFCPFFLPLCCLFFFELGILITPLVSSNSFYIPVVHTYMFRIRSVFLMK